MVLLTYNSAMTRTSASFAHPGAQESSHSGDCNLEVMAPYFLAAVVVAQSLSHVWLFVGPWTAVHQASLSFTISQSVLKLMSI